MDTYNGWTNWETWNVNLWLTNDEGTYNHVHGLDAEDLEKYWITYFDRTDGIDSDKVNWREIQETL